MIRHVGRHESTGVEDIDLRDQLTIDRLRDGVAHIAEVEVLRFDSDWWDGRSHGPCLVVRVGEERAKRRVREVAGEPVVLAFRRRQAERQLAAGRTAHPVPNPRIGDDIVIDVTADAIRCPGAGCGVMLEVAATGPCPGCGRHQG